MKKVTKTIVDTEIKEIDEKTKTIWHKITKETKDRMGDIIRIDGIDTKNFKKKPTVLYGHSYSGLDPLPVVGKNKGFKKDGKSLYAGTSFLTDEGLSQKLKDLGNDLWILAKEKLIGWSVGFIPKKTEDIMEDGHLVGFDFKEIELLEYSAVLLPAHQDAVMDMVKGGQVSQAITKAFDGKKEELLPGEIAAQSIDEALLEANDIETNKDSQQLQELDPVDIDKIFSIVEKIKESREESREHLKRNLMEDKI